MQILKAAHIDKIYAGAIEGGETRALDEVNLLSNLNEVFILNETKWEKEIPDLSGFEATVHLINLENWQESEAAVHALEQNFTDLNSSTSGMDVENIIPEEELFRVVSRVDGYENAKNSNGIIFFITIFLSVLFFIGTFFILYIQIFSEADKEADRIRKLQRIGIKSEEVKKIMTQELTTIFMLPMLLGSTLAFIYFITMAAEPEKFLPHPEIIGYFFTIAGIYLLMLFAFLLYARKKMLREYSRKVRA